MTRRTWETVIGLETHAQLSTRSKIFSGSSTAFGAAANVQACAVDIALPGVLPVLNGAAVECAIKFGLAVGGKIAPRSIFARKNYFYPDLPKGYQISQYELPVVVGGTLVICVGQGADSREKTVQLTRAHLEEDAGKSLHEDFQGRSGIDLNRAGTPLLEIVSEPDMRSALEAVAYAKMLHALLRWIGICDGNMQEGSFRVDANVSVRRAGEPLGTRCEIKNLNSFRFLEKAIEYEVQRQIEIIEDGGSIHQETRLFDSERGHTRSMRSKEDAHDYRYFPDPDLLPLEITPASIAAIKAQLPELPGTMQLRFQEVFGLSSYDAAALTQSREQAAYFEEVVHILGGEAKLAANWILGNLSAYFNETGKTIIDSPITASALAGLIRRCVDNTLSNKLAKDVLHEMWQSGATSVDAADRIIAAHDLKQITDAGAIESVIDAVLAANGKSVEEFRAGKDKAFNALVGQAMKATKGQANPQQVTELLRKKLGDIKE
jgi:aspartyl-tRNA(Asn)/glutamyl-tRNA(Gln) amidotransferase subunit B